jgi:hypothetical protein
MLAWVSTYFGASAQCVVLAVVADLTFDVGGGRKEAHLPENVRSVER